MPILLHWIARVSVIDVYFSSFWLSIIGPLFNIQDDNYSQKALTNVFRNSIKSFCSRMWQQLTSQALAHERVKHLINSSYSIHAIRLWNSYGASVQKISRKQRSNDIDLCTESISFAFEIASNKQTGAWNKRKQVFFFYSQTQFTASFLFSIHKPNGFDGCVGTDQSHANGIMSFLLCNMCT